MDLCAWCMRVPKQHPFEDWRSLFLHSLASYFAGVDSLSHLGIKHKEEKPK